MADSQVLSGQTVSDYRTLQELGAEGGGAVYLARDSTVDRTVAPKYLLFKTHADHPARRPLLDHPFTFARRVVSHFEGHMRLLGVALILVWLVPVRAAAQDVGTITFLEGSLRMIRGATVYQVEEGVRLKQGDIVETSENGFAQLEFVGGPIVVLGPSSHAYIFRRSAGGELILLSGWLKGLSAAHTVPYRFASPLLTATTSSGTVVFHSSETGCDVFIESGSATIAASSAENAGKPTTGNAGQFFFRHSGKPLASSPRPSTAFLDAVPRAFRDDLPSRLTHFVGKPPEPKAQHAVSYAEIQAWLTMPPEWRKGFVERFEPRLEDPEFRKQVEAHAAEYPEWEQVLHPN